MTRGTQVKVNLKRLEHLCKQHLTNAVIAERLGVSKAAVWQARQRLAVLA